MSSFELYYGGPGMEESPCDDELDDVWCEDGTINDEYRELHTIGYRDGIAAGKEASAQEGFNIGFKQSASAGYNFGIVRGISSDCLLVQVKGENRKEGRNQSLGMEGSSESPKVVGNPQDLAADPLGMFPGAGGNRSPPVARLRELLFRRMLIGVSDGRFFTGIFHCIDKQGNIILQDAVEYRSTRRSSPAPMEQRCLGLILIPASCRSSCHVDCSVEEQLSLLAIHK